MDTSMYSIGFDNISKAVYVPDSTSIWSGNSDPASLQAFIDRMKSNQFVVTSIVSSDGSKILIDMVGSGLIQPAVPWPPLLTPPPEGGNPPKDLAMDMTVFGVYDLSSIQSVSGDYTSPVRTSDASKNRAFDPIMGCLFVLASLLVFWG
jgi:hypothetical protein